ncbi:MAG: 50S ribosomal protein L9 [Terriglobia bacterium]
MKVILKKSLDNLGLEGDVVDVARGYARNYLIRKDLALPATPGNIAATAHIVKAREKAEAEGRKKAEELATVIEGQTVRIAAKAGKEKLYGTITAKEISQALKEQKDLEVDRKKIVLEQNVKTLGNHDFVVKLFPDVAANVKLDVVKEEE